MLSGRLHTLRHPVRHIKYPPPFISRVANPVRWTLFWKGGSLYWVIGGFIQARQTLRDFTVFEHEEQPSPMSYQFLIPNLFLSCQPQDAPFRAGAILSQRRPLRINR